MNTFFKPILGVLDLNKKLYDNTGGGGSKKLVGAEVVKLVEAGFSSAGNLRCAKYIVGD